MRRRNLLRTIGTGATGLVIAGCLTREGDDGDGGNETEDGGDETENGDGTEGDGETGDDGTETGDDGTETGEETDGEGSDISGTLRVATYESMVDSDDAAGVWIKDAFEEAYPETTIDWVVPEDAVNHYIQRAQQGADIDADLYLGINVDDLVRVDDNLDDGTLFRELDRDRLEHADRVREDLEIADPEDRVIPYDTGYISLVYDESEVDEPTSFADLTDPEYEGALLAQNAQTSDPGQAFMLWTILQHGEEGYLDYWNDLLDNDVRIIGDWTESYFGSYMEGDRPMVVSYSTDQVYANRFDYDMTRHQVAFLEEQGYANPETVGIFEGSQNEDLAYAFVDFLLSSEAQAEIAVRNVQFPAVTDDHVDLDEEFDEYAHEPPEPVKMDYDDLSGNLDGWLEDWGREVEGR